MYSSGHFIYCKIIGGKAMGTYLYCVLPFIAWVASGVLKFLVNYLRSGKDAFRLVGNGGFPSTHTTILSSMVMTIGFHEGFNTPMFGIGMAILTIVIIDATGLRRTVGKHAKMLNKHISSEEEKLRERQGHHWHEIFGGLVLGIVIGYVAHLIMVFLP